MLQYNVLLIENIVLIIFISPLSLMYHNGVTYLKKQQRLPSTSVTKSKACVCVCVCVYLFIYIRVLFVLQRTAFLRTAWDRVSSYFIHILTPFHHLLKRVLLFTYLHVISATTIDLGPSICLMKNNYWRLPGFITGQFCSRLIAMGTPGVGTGCLSWEARRFLYARFYSGRRFRKWIASVPDPSGRFGMALLLTH